MKFGFVSCVKLGLTCMETIYEIGGRLDLVLTLKDNMAANKSGRIYVDEFCTQHRIDLLKIKNVNDDEAINAVKEFGLDWLFIIGWSQVARKAILCAPKHGVIGMHPTLLPQGRGRAAIPWAILKGLPETGVTMFKLDEGVDTGPIIVQEKIPISPSETATKLYEKVCDAHRSLIRCAWQDFVDDKVVLRTQDSSKASEWPARRPEDGVILPHMEAKEAERLIRATTRPYPGAFWNDEEGVLRIWSGVIGKADQEPPANAKRIHLRDGVIDALDFQFE